MANMAAALIDSEDGGVNSMTNSPSFMERQFVHDVYSEIAPCFEMANQRWPKVSNFLEQLPDGSLVADVGCGDGRYLASEPAVAGRLAIIGADVCHELINVARQCSRMAPACDVFVADNLRLPLKTDVFDAVISVGVLHHFATAERRLAALAQLSRLLRPGGRLLVYVWALEQPKRQFSSQDILVPSSEKRKTVKPSWPTRNGHSFVFDEFPNWPNVEPNNNDNKPSGSPSSQSLDLRPRRSSSNLLNKVLPPFMRLSGRSNTCSDVRPGHNNKNKRLNNDDDDDDDDDGGGDGNESRITNSGGANSLYRFYHVFCRGELETLVDDLNKLETTQFPLKVIRSFYDHANWAVELQRP